MNIPLKIKKYVAALLGIVACGVILSCVNHGGYSKGKIDVTTNGIIIHPTIQLPALEVQKLDNTLKNFDKSLYKIVTLKKGFVTETRGRLADAKIDATLRSEVAAAEKAGTDVYTEQFVIHGTGVADVREDTPESNELIKNIQPILDKYR